MRAKQVDLGEVVIHYGDSETAGPELVFFHGYPSQWEVYEEFLVALSKDFRVLAPSMRGMGGSGRASRYHVEDYVRDQAAFITTVMSPPVICVGQGGGPWFAAAAAAQSPGLLRALVSMDEPFSPETNIADNEEALGHRTAVAQLLRSGSNFDDFRKKLASVDIGDGVTFGDLGEQRLRLNAELLFTLDPKTLDHWQSLATMTAFLDVPVLQGLPGEYRGPVLFLSGDLNAPYSCTERDVEVNLAQYPWADSERLTGMDTHQAMKEAPDALAERVCDWLLRNELR